MVDHQVDTREREAIANALRDAANGDFADAAPALLKTLGYESSRRPRAAANVDDFLTTYPRKAPDGRQNVPPDTPPTHDEKLLRDHALSIQVLFQYSENAIPPEVRQGTSIADGSGGFDPGRQRSFLFVCAELNQDSFPRGRYAAFTREINRRFPQIPAVVLFRTPDKRVTLSFVNRRPNVRDPERDVLGAVSLIREIDPRNPHRAHLDILLELSIRKRLAWIEKENRPPNFDGLLAAWLDTLDTEELNRRFFTEYNRIFTAAMETITGFDKTEEGKSAKRLFTQTLFNRLMFVHFLSRKGWLNIGGDTDYLHALWNRFQAERKPLPSGNMPNFYDERLKVLFFTGLNNPRSANYDDGPAALIGKVPFLNGGLFEESNVDKRNDIVVPDSIIEMTLDDLFRKFHFTVTESTPLEIEVSVDPEMLGMMFEELVNERHDSGAYYTPRPVVSFMCREAIKGYLEGKDTGADVKAIAAFVDTRNTDGITIGAARNIDRALDEITVVDPACGSGAFLLGMMSELIELYTTLYNAGVDARSLYNLKLHIIQRSLYGVDIDKFAANIAMLRLWLSLAIDYEDDAPEKLPPLPNLDFKIITGDSLLGPDPNPDKYPNLFRNRAIEIADELAGLKGEYMKAYTGPDKQRLRNDVQSLETELTEALSDSAAPDNAVDWRVQFAEVFNRGGFDVAIGNPPYVQLQADQGRLANMYADMGYQTFARTGDIYYLFYERGINLVQDGGHLCFISSNQWMKVDSARALRRFFETQDPLRLVNIGEGVFENVTVNTGVLIVRRAPLSNRLDAADVRQAEQPFPPAEWVRISPANGKTWTVLSGIDHQIKAKMEARGTQLQDWDVRINRGIVTGRDKAFIINTETRNALIEQDPKSEEIIKPMLKGQDIQRWQAKRAGRWLLFVPWHFPLHDSPTISGSSVEAESAFQMQYPAVFQYLEGHRASLEARNTAETGVRYEWYALQRWAAKYHHEFSKEKIAWGNLNKRATFARVSEGMLLTAPSTMLTPYSPYLLAVLNSTLLDWYFMQIGVQRDAGYYEYKPMFIERLPVPIIAPDEQRPFTELVDSILEKKDENPAADVTNLESEIDTLVYALYDLKDKEIAAVEGRG